MHGRGGGTAAPPQVKAGLTVDCKSAAVAPSAFDATSFLSFPPLCTVGAVAVVVNHLHLTDPISDETVQAFRSIVPRIVNGGASAAQVVQVDDTHIVLILEFTSAEDADRVASEIGGPWMREHIIPLLARGPERSVARSSPPQPRRASAMTTNVHRVAPGGGGSVIARGGGAGNDRPDDSVFADGGGDIRQDG